jgi:HEAT repeat protein
MILMPLAAHGRGIAGYINLLFMALLFGLWTSASGWADDLAGSQTNAKIETLIGALENGSVAVQSNAITELVEIGSPSVEPLITALKRGNQNSRRNAADALGRIKDRRAVEPLIAAFADRAAQSNAVQALTKIGEPAVVSLVAALKDADRFVRWNAADVLGRIKDTRAVEPLIASFKDADAGVRYTAALALSEIGDPRGVEPLISALKAQKEWSYVPKALAKMGQVAVEPLIATLKFNHPTVRKTAADVLGDIKDARAVGPLIAALKDKEWEVRLHAVDALDHIRDSRAIVPLIAAVKDESPEVRAHAASALGNFNNVGATKVSIATLSAELESAPDHYLNSYIIKSLAQIGGAESLKEHLTHWTAGKQVASALLKLQWTPTTTKEQVHLWIAQRDKKTLLSNWDTTKSVLLTDITARKERIVVNALYAGIGIGNVEFIRDAISALNNRGTKETAEAFLNCGHPELRKAAQMWAAKRGFSIVPSSFGGPVGWGRM